jgi:hypothetical protein
MHAHQIGEDIVGAAFAGANDRCDAAAADHPLCSLGT